MEADHHLPQKHVVEDSVLLGEYLQQHLQKSGNNHLLHYGKSMFSMRSKSQSVPKSEEANLDPPSLMKVASSSSLQSTIIELHRKGLKESSSSLVFSSKDRVLMKEAGNQKQEQDQSSLLSRSLSSSVSCAQSSQYCESTSSLGANHRSTSMEFRKRRQYSCDNLGGDDVDENNVFTNQLSAFDLLVSAAFHIGEAEEGDAKNTCSSAAGSPVKSVDGPVSVYGVSPLPKKRVCRRAKNAFQKKQSNVGLLFQLGTFDDAYVKKDGKEYEEAAIAASNVEELGISNADLVKKKEKECDEVAIDVNTGQGTQIKHLHQGFVEYNTRKSRSHSDIVQYNRRKSHGKSSAHSKAESTKGLHKGEVLQKSDTDDSCISKSEADFNKGLNCKQELYYLYGNTSQVRSCDDILPSGKSEANFNEGLKRKQELDNLSANTSNPKNDMESLPPSKSDAKCNGQNCKQELDNLSANTSKQKNGMENLPAGKYDAKFNEDLKCKQEEDNLSANLPETVVSSIAKKEEDVQSAQLSTATGSESPNCTNINYDPRTPSPPSSKNTPRVCSHVQTSENAQISFLGHGKSSRQSRFKVKCESNEAEREDDVKMTSANPVLRIKFLPIKLPNHNMPALQDVSKPKTPEVVPPTSMVTRKRKQLLDKQQRNEIATPTIYDTQPDVKKEDYVVRTKCGRSQVLPTKYSDSIIQSWKRTPRKKPKGMV